MCDKLSFDSFQQAQSVVNVAGRIKHYSGGKRSKHRGKKTPKRAYKCPDCGKYHLTSQKRKPRQKNTKKDSVIQNLIRA